MGCLLCIMVLLFDMLPPGGWEYADFIPLECDEGISGKIIIVYNNIFITFAAIFEKVNKHQLLS